LKQNRSPRGRPTTSQLASKPSSEGGGHALRNVGHAQSLDAPVLATTFLRDPADLAVVIIRFGALHSEAVAPARPGEVYRGQVLPHQPRTTPPMARSAADFHSFGLVGGLSTSIVPSRLYGNDASAWECRHDLAEMGRRGRQYTTAEADREVALARYRAALRELLDGRRP